MSPSPGQDPCASSPHSPCLPTTGPVGSRWRDYSALAVIMAGIAFGFHHLYKVGLPFPTAPLALSPILPSPELYLDGGSHSLAPWQEWGYV